MPQSFACAGAACFKTKGARYATDCPDYLWFFTVAVFKEVVRHVPVAVVDYDHSSLSQTIISYALANPRIQSTIVNDENSAKQQLMWVRQDCRLHGDTPGAVSKVTTGQPAKVSILLPTVTIFAQ